MNSARQLVSVIIPCYNAERWVAAAVQSALSQSWEEVEVIVVDDGSTDGSLEQVSRIHDPRLNIISQRNSGASSARNTGLNYAQGKYIQFLDADDLLSADKIEAAVRTIDHYDAPMVAISSVGYFRDGSDHASAQIVRGWPHIDSDDTLHWLIDLLGGFGRAGMVQPGAWLVPKAIVDRVGPWRRSLSLDDDGEYFARIVLASTGIRRVPSGVAYYRKFISGRNLSAGTKRVDFRSALRASEYKASLLMERQDSAAVRTAICRQLWDIAYRSYVTAPDISRIAERTAQEFGPYRPSPSMGTALGRAVTCFAGWRLGLRLQHVYQTQLTM